MKRALSVLILTLLLTNALAAATNTRTAKASGTIYIKEDGSVDPLTAPIDQSGNVYSLTGNITINTDGIIIERNGVRFNGAGYTIHGTQAGTGITLSERGNITIENAKICHFIVGIVLMNSSSVDLFGNTLAENGRGIDLSYSSYNTLYDNTLTRSEQGIAMLESDHNDLSNNTVTDSATGIALWHSSYCNVSGNILTENGCGIVFTDVAGEKVFHNNFAGNIIQVEVNLWCSPHILWYDKSTSSGNFWSDYAERYPQAAEIGESGIWSASYFVSRGNTDPFPLVHPYGSSIRAADVNRDLRVNILDVVIITSSFGATPASASWNPCADTGKPYGRVDVFDVVLCLSHYGEEYS